MYNYDLLRKTIIELIHQEHYEVAVRKEQYCFGCEVNYGGFTPAIRLDNVSECQLGIVSGLHEVRSHVHLRPVEIKGLPITLGRLIRAIQNFGRHVRVHEDGYIEIYTESKGCEENPCAWDKLCDWSIITDTGEEMCLDKQDEETKYALFDLLVKNAKEQCINTEHHQGEPCNGSCQLYAVDEEQFNLY